jgi:hypothetical protein
MPIFNILDQRRTNEYNPAVDAVYEVFADNWADFGLPPNTQDFTEWQHIVSIYAAVCIAQRFAGRVTMFLYDPGWVIDNFGFIVVVHPKLKRDVMVPHQYDTKLLRAF